MNSAHFWRCIKALAHCLHVFMHFLWNTTYFSTGVLEPVPAVTRSPLQIHQHLLTPSHSRSVWRLRSASCAHLWTPIDAHRAEEKPESWDSEPAHGDMVQFLSVWPPRPLSPGLTQAFFFIERPVDHLTAFAVTQTDATAVLHCVWVNAIVTADILVANAHQSHREGKHYRAAGRAFCLLINVMTLKHDILLSCSTPPLPLFFFCLLPSHTTLHTPLTQMLLELFTKQGVPSVTASSIFSEKYSVDGRQWSSQGWTADNRKRFHF